MIDEEPLLREKFSDLLGWQRIQRREKILVEVLFYSVLASLAALPAGELVSPWMDSLAWPPLLFAILTPAFFLLRPWGGRERLRFLFFLDQTLRLEARAITAWEILNRGERKHGEALVLKETWERLKSADFKSLFRRRRSWQEIFAPPLLLLWLLVVWLGAGFEPGKGVNGSRLDPLAQSLKEFSRDLQDRAKAQGLNESLKVARALEEAAEKSLKGELNKKKLAEDLAATVGRIGDISPGTEETALQFSGTPQEGLLDLKTEIEAFKSTLSPRKFDQREKTPGAEMLGKLSALPRLSEEIGRRLPSLQEMGEMDLSSLLEKIEQGVTAELDRRMLQEIGEFLNLLLRGGEGGERGEALQLAERAARGGLSEAEKIRGKGNSPGSQPGTKEQTLQPAPPTTAGGASRLKGLLREGKSGSIPLRGEFSSKGSIVPRQELPTSYRRQVEEELGSEQIPEGLKETVRRYFLSLGFSESKRGE